jgi:integrase
MLALNTTMRGCELKGLRRKDIDLFEKTLTIRRDSTKTDAGARVIPLNRDAVATLSELLTRADQLGVIEPDHFVFPASECGVIDPTKPMKG